MTLVNTIKTKMGDSLLLTLIYTIGHFMIAVACVYFITGAPLELATIDAQLNLFKCNLVVHTA